MSATNGSEGTTSDMVPEQRQVMPEDIYAAAVKGDTGFLVQRLGLLEEGRNQNSPAELQCVTHLGDNVLHLLVTEGSNDKTAQMIFQKGAFLLKAINLNIETPLHIAAKAGNYEVIKNLIQIDSGMVKDALRVADNNGDTALHTAAKHGHILVSRELMNVDRQVAHRVNKEGSTALHIAIVEGYTDMVKMMLGVDLNLVFTQLSDGMFPIHAAAHMGNTNLVEHFFENYPDSMKLEDQYGRIFFHIAAAENREEIFVELLFKATDNKTSTQNVNDPHVIVVGNELQEQALVRGTVATADKNGWRTNEISVMMINAKDYQGNTPLHIAAMKGAKETVHAIWKRLLPDEAVETNNKGLTAFDLSMIQLKENKTKEHLSSTLFVNIEELLTNTEVKIENYVKYNGKKFTRVWFTDIMGSSINMMEKIQLIGLGSVLITTVTFAAAFTFPGGYNADKGFPLLGRRYMFRAFVLANTLAFIQAFASIFSLILNTLARQEKADHTFASIMFLLAASSMVVAFGSGSYVMLVPINKSIAVIIFVLSLLFGTPTVLYIDQMMIILFRRLDYMNYVSRGTPAFIFLSMYGLLFMFIFCLAFLT